MKTLIIELNIINIKGKTILIILIVLFNNRSVKVGHAGRLAVC